MKRTLLLPAFVLSLTAPAATENYGYIPDASIYLSGGFDPLYPQRSFPQCIASTAECQLGALGANVCLSSKTQDASEPDHKFGVTTNFTMKQITSKYEFYKEVNVSLSMSGSYGPFSASGSFSSFDMDEIKEDSLTWMILAKSHYGSFGIQNPELNAGSKALKGLELLSKCGVSYVSQVDRGVIAAAVFSIYNLDEKHRHEMSAKLSAGFSAGFSVSGSGSYSEIVKEAMSYGSMSLHVYTIGGEAAPGLSAIIEKDPTDLASIKKTLSDYVGKQDKTRAAIIGFRTTGFGKLVNNASIDPDQSNYAYYLEEANRFRLKLLDGVARIQKVLENQADFSDSAVDDANVLRDSVGCELRYVETQIQACRLSYDIVRTAMTDGRDNNDRPATLAMNFGMSSDENSGIRLCEQPDQTRTLAAQTTPILFSPMGWSIGADLVEGALGTARARSRTDDQRALDACKQRNELAQKKYQKSLASAGKRQDLCIAGCELVTNPELLQRVKELPSLPFEIEYWFESGIPTFGSQHTPGVYLIVRGADRVQTISFFADAGTSPFAVNTYRNQRTISEFVPQGSFTGDSIRLQFTTVANNVYEFVIPKTNPL
ncbi:MAG: hypothetical protein E5X76_17945 [Mesorhizobium sp.]|nr:MAG: hypothetical protein E5X76_17945 [Mesorhizobium sp.]